MIPDRANNAENWEFDKLIVILLRQFKRLLDAHDAALTDAQMQQIGADIAARQPVDAAALQARDALTQIVAESVEQLKTWDLTFARALATPMTDMPNWETTADFLEIANEKVNAEVRISAGSSLLVALGDDSYATFLLQAIDHDLSEHGTLDVDAVLAKRTLLHTAKINPDADDWLEQARVWVSKNASA